MTKPTMFLIVGPNGVGKSTLYENKIKPLTRATFINADVIQREVLRDPSMGASYRAAEMAEALRQQHLSSKTSFVTESTFSHPSKLALVNQARTVGFRVVLYHVSVRSPNLSVGRVSIRVARGGHDVPEDKIRERFERNKPLIRQAALLADKAFVYDNSELGKLPSLILSFDRGRVRLVNQSVPAWVREIYAQELAPFSPAVLNPAAASFADAKEIALRIGGPQAALQVASSKESRGYLGPLVGESALHYVQRLGDTQFVAHFKSGFPANSGLNRLYLIKYANSSVVVQEKNPVAVLAAARAKKIDPTKINGFERLFASVATPMHQTTVKPRSAAPKGPKI